MKPVWSKPKMPDIVIQGRHGAEVPVAVKGFVTGSIGPLKKLAEQRGVHLIHDGRWPPIAVLCWETLNQLVDIGKKGSIMMTYASTATNCARP